VRLIRFGAAVQSACAEFLLAQPLVWIGKSAEQKDQRAYFSGAEINPFRPGNGRLERAIAPLEKTMR